MTLISRVNEKDCITEMNLISSYIQNLNSLYDDYNLFVSKKSQS